VGHNIGCQHDRNNTGTTINPGYNYGYQDEVNRFRTIMAYSCPGFTCTTRLNVYSSPLIRHNGAPVGIANGSLVAPACDNARWIRERIFSVTRNRLGQFESPFVCSGVADVTVDSAFVEAALDYTPGLNCSWRICECWGCCVCICACV
jgi:hypothetical protein